MQKMWRVGGTRGRRLKMTDCGFGLVDGIFVYAKACSFKMDLFQIFK